MKNTGNKKLKKISYLVVILIASVVTVYLVSPLFISTEINEPFPPNSVALVSFENFSVMSEEERVKVAQIMNTFQKNELMSQYANSENGNIIAINESMDEISGSSELNYSPISGSFIGANDGIHNAEGIAKIIPLEENAASILRLENLKVTNGPDLYVYLSTDNNSHDFVNLGKLKANNGNQNYNIPLGTDLSKYDTVLIWCKAFSVLFGSADLKHQE